MIFTSHVQLRNGPASLLDRIQPDMVALKALQKGSHPVFGIIVAIVPGAPACKASPGASCSPRDRDFDRASPVTTGPHQRVCAGCAAPTRPVAASNPEGSSRKMTGALGRGAEDDSEHDQLLRFWAPWNLLWEDPVTGSAQVPLSSAHPSAHLMCPCKR